MHFSFILNSTGSLTKLFLQQKWLNKNGSRLTCLFWVNWSRDLKEEPLESLCSPDTSKILTEGSSDIYYNIWSVKFPNRGFYVRMYRNHEILTYIFFIPRRKNTENRSFIYSILNIHMFQNICIILPLPSHVTWIQNISYTWLRE